jgi:hypothetical protein
MDDYVAETVIDRTDFHYATNPLSQTLTAPIACHTISHYPHSSCSLFYYTAFGLYKGFCHEFPVYPQEKGNLYPEKQGSPTYTSTKALS